MKAKLIKSILRHKIDAWLGSITDEALRKRVSDNVIVTGGCIVSMLMGEKISDFDVYLRHRDVAKALAEHYLALFKPKMQNGIASPLSIQDDGERIRIVVKSAGIASEDGTDKPYEYFEGRPAQDAGEYVGDIIADPGEIEDAHEETEKAALATTGVEKEKKYRPVFLTSNAITLSDKVQIIIRFWGEPDEIHSNYDFVHCTCYWTSWDSNLVLRPEALEAMLARELRYVGSKYPICSLVRVRKFVERGWRINAGQLLKMAMQISKLDLTNIKVLEDQLTGVDTAYFVQLIDKLKEKDPDQVDSAYLIEIVDRIF
jgi:hypothetical protein